MRIAFAADHAAVALKRALADWAREQGHEVSDLGPHDETSVDYPDYGYRLAETIAAGEADLGVALCGSGIGISIAVNRNPACRCARVSDGLSARLARRHNDANVIAMGARLVGIDLAKHCLEEFLDTGFDGAKEPNGRHARRVEKLTHPSKEPA